MCIFKSFWRLLGLQSGIGTFFQGFLAVPSARAVLWQAGGSQAVWPSPPAPTTATTPLGLGLPRAPGTPNWVILEFEPKTHFIGVSCKLMFCLDRNQFTRHPYEMGSISGHFGIANGFILRLEPGWSWSLGSRVGVGWGRQPEGQGGWLGEGWERGWGLVYSLVGNLCRS